jgi:hypothetical protein
MLELLFGLIPGLFNTVNGITKAITNEKINLAKSQTDADRIAAEEKIASLQAKRDVLIAESGSSRINAFIRAGIGASVLIILAKLFVWDKVIGSINGCAIPAAWKMIECHSFRTDALDGNLWNVIMATIGFYFVYEGAVNATRIIKS